MSANRVVLIGNAFVGKTALIQKKISSEVPHRYEETVGAAFHTYKEVIDGKEIVIQVWDTAGQEKYRSLGPVYFRNATVAVLVYDVTDRSTFEALDEWIRSFRNVAGMYPHIVIVGNKCDLDTKIVVDKIEGQNYAENHGMKFFYTSALTGYNVDFLFQNIAQIVASEPLLENTTTKKKEEKSGCC